MENTEFKLIVVFNVWVILVSTVALIGGTIWELNL